MFKKVLFLALILCTTAVYAQDRIAEMFRPDNPNLMNLNEPKKYEGEPLVYIEGVKAPEQATNDLEELQLAVFGTKDIQSKTRNSLTFPPIKRKNTLKPNITIQTPFHQTVQAGLMRHIPDFFVTVNVLNDSQITVTEQASIVSVIEGETWSRNIPLLDGVDFQITSYAQNGEEIPVEMGKEGNLFFRSSIPLKLGLNHVLLKYTLSNAIQNNILKLDITGSDFNWPIERADMMVYFPSQVQFIQNKLLFGTNEMEVPQTYDVQTDDRGNTLYHFTRILPPLASIRIYMELKDAMLPPESFWVKFWNNTNLLLMTSISVILVLYWILYAVWTKRQARKDKMPKIKNSTNWLTVAYQMKVALTTDILAALKAFLQQHNMPVKIPQRLLKEQNKKIAFPLMTKIKNVIHWVGELFIGSLLLLGIYVFISQYLEISINLYFICFWIIAMLVVLALFYHGLFRPYAQHRWQKCVQKFSTDEAIIGLTKTQAKLVYPLMILTNTANQWLSRFQRLNPKEAKEIRSKGGTK